MTIYKKPFGVIAAAVTPLTPEGSIATDDLPIFLDFLAQRGAHGILLLGTAGEGPSFAQAERLQIIQAALPVRQAHPDLQLLAGTGAPSLEETVNLNRAAFDLGVDGVVILPPYYFRKAGEDGLYEWYAQVIRRSVPAGCAILVYHIPAMTGIHLSMGLVARLMEAFPDRIFGIKDSTSDAEFARLLGARFGKELLTFTGNDSLFDLALENRASGCITAMANLRSPDLRLVWDARTQGRVDAAACLRLERGRNIVDRYSPTPPLYKALLARLHHFPFWSVRPPLTPMTDLQIEKALSEATAEVEGFSD